MATTIALTSQAGTNAPYKLGSPPDFGTLYSGRALDFDGVVDTFSVSTPITAADSYTIALWFYSDGNSSVMMWENKDATSNPSLEGSDSNWRFYSNGSTSVSTGAVSTGAWHHLVATYNESDLAMGLYLDGVLVDSDTANATTSQDIATLHIGSRAGTSKFFDGKMSNFQIWDKAWSLSDVQYAYTHPEKLITHNSAVTSGTTISNLKAWYPCTEGNPRSPQTTVYDGSPKGLGSEIIIGNNSTFDSGYGDWVPNSSDTSIEATGGALKITRIGSSGNVNVRVKIELTSSMKTTGTIWKFEWDMWKDVDTTYFECSMAGNSGSVGKAIIDLNPVSTTRQSYTGYFTQLSTGDMYFNCAMGDGVTGSYYIDNILNFMGLS